LVLAETRAAVVISAGFGEQGASGRALQQAMLDAARPHLLRLVGPNCVGTMVPAVGLDASFSHIVPLAGDLAFVSQSGGMITAVLDWAAAREIGFSHVVSLGDMVDVDFGDTRDAGEHRSRLAPHSVRTVEVERHAPDIALMRQIARADLERHASSDLRRGCGTFCIGNEPGRG
jgi:hypothetical protein